VEAALGAATWPAANDLDDLLAADALARDAASGRLAAA
jgi:hypothetical protein